MTAPFKVDYTDTAAGELRRIARGDRNTASRIARAVDALGTDPRPPGARVLAGRRDLLRIRVGTYRVIYSVDDGIATVLAVRVANRGEVYRRLTDL